MANGNIKRSVMEEGIILERIFKPAREEFRAQDGRVVPSSPDTYYLKCVSGEEFDDVNGYKGSLVLNYAVEKTIFDTARYGDAVIVRYEISNNGEKALSVKLV